MRILKGYSKEERAELEDAKETENLGNFLHNITGYPEDTDCGYVWDNYHKASSREQFSIIEDILDFYTGKAKFPEQKYYVKLLDRDEGYLNYQHSFNEFFVDDKDDYEDGDYKTQFTMSEIEAIDPRYKQFAVPVEADNENGTPGHITWDKAVYAIEALSEEANSKPVMPKVFADWDFEEHECCDCYEIQIDNLISMYFKNDLASDSGRILLKWINQGEFEENTVRLLKCIDAIRYGYEVEK